MSTMDVSAPQTVLPTSKWLTKNPMLSDTPLGAYTDAQYEAAAAQLRARIARSYADILEQLGYKDDTGNFIPGTVEAQARKHRLDLQRSMGIAGEEVTKRHQQEGTLFSGLRGTNLARAEYPFAQGISDLDTNTPIALGKLYENAAGLSDEWVRENNSLLADAAARAAAGFGTQPGQVVTPPGGLAAATGPTLGNGGVTPLPAPGGPVDTELAGLPSISGAIGIGGGTPFMAASGAAGSPASGIGGAVRTPTKKTPRIWGGQASLGRY